MKNSLLKLAIIVGLGFWALSPELAIGQSGQALPTVEVQGSFANPPFTQEQKVETTNRLVYDAADLENSSADTLSDFLAEMGVAVVKAATDYDHTLMTIRGFRTDHLSKELDGHILFLIDGRRTGTSNPSQIPLLNVQRVEILRGPEMLKYSGAAAGGVINVVTKRGGPDKLSGSLEVGAGSFDYYKTQLNLNGLFNNFDYSIGYSYSQKGDYKDGHGDKVDDSEVDAVYGGLANFGYTFNGRHRIGWATYYYEVNDAKRPAYYDDANEQEFGPSVMDRYNISNSITYEGSTEDERLSWEVSYTFGENWSKQYASGIKQLPMAAKFDRKVFQSRVTYKGDNFDLTGGFDYLDYDTEEGSPKDGERPSNPPKPVGLPMIPTGKYENLAGYLVGDLRLMEDRLVITAGLRYDQYKVKDKRQDPGDQASLPLKHAGQRLPWSKTFTHLSPSFGISYLPIDWLKLRANYTNSMRPPSPRELTSGWYEPYNFWGYPWNKAEKTNTYEGGFDLNFPFFNLSSTYFYSETKDYVYQHSSPDVPPPPPGVNLRQRVRNADKQIRAGLELGVSGNVAGALGYDNFELRPYFTYTHLFKMAELFREDYNGPLVFGDWRMLETAQIPRTTMSGGIRFRYPSIKFNANLNFTYFGRIPYYLPVPRGVPADTDTPKSYIPGFTIANLSLRKGLVDFDDKGNMELRVDVTNLFDRQYRFGTLPAATATTKPYYLPGRAFYVGLIYNY
ncbi:MAG: TonB-dependent receptor [Deltaproteobacteria bacterium]|jgi:outer membrane receptor protein involved in Fe transport|nr:TonB-dependent receptor [Deltaproteobacteria bacterium]